MRYERELQTAQEKSLAEFLEQIGGPALNISGLEKMLKIPFRSIRDWRNGRQPLAKKHLDTLEAWAKSITYKNTEQ